MQQSILDGFYIFNDSVLYSNSIPSEKSILGACSSYISSSNILSSVHNFYQDAFSNLITAVSIFVAISALLVAIILGVNIYWNIARYKNHVREKIDISENNLQRNIIESFINVGEQIYSSRRKTSTRDVFLQYLLALNILVSLKFKKENSDLYETVLEGIHQHWNSDSFSNKSLSLIPLKKLREKLQNEKKLTNKIDSITNVNK